MFDDPTDFGSFLGSYNIFMAPLCAVIIVNYFVTTKGNIHIPSCYDGKPSALYWYTFGTNWCGVLAWTLGTTMGIPGLIGQYQPQIISAAAGYMYMMGFILTFTTSAVVYYGLTVFIKPRVFPAGFEGSPFKWEWLAKEGRDGFFEEEKAEVLGSETPTTTYGETVEMGEKGDKNEA